MKRKINNKVNIIKSQTFCDAVIFSVQSRNKKFKSDINVKRINVIIANFIACMLIFQYVVQKFVI